MFLVFGPYSKLIKVFACQTVDFTVAAHDTTGGMEAKISEAAMIAKLGIDVYIVKVIIVTSRAMLLFNYCSTIILNLDFAALRN